MKWMQLLGTAVVLCGTVLLSACGGGEMPAPAEPPASSEVPAPSQPEEVPAPSESASSSEPEPPASSVPEKENPLIANGVLKSYDTGKQKNVVLPGGKFTKISSGCFKNNTTMESVIIPEGVTEIGFAAFAQCYNLKSVKLPKSLVKIEQSAFLDCVSLEEITFPENSRLELYQSAFENSGLLKVFIPSNIRIMNGGVFADCKKLISVDLEGQETIEKQTFASCYSLRTVILGKATKEIRAGAFDGCSNLSDVWYAGSWDELLSGCNKEWNGAFFNAEHHEGAPSD